MSSARRARQHAESFLMGNSIHSGAVPPIPGEVSSFGFAINKAGRLAISEVVGDYVAGVTLPAAALDALVLVVARALVARAEDDGYECSRCGDTGGCWPARCAALVAALPDKDEPA